MMFGIRQCVAAFAALVVGSVYASPEEPDFYQDIYPFLKTNCISCHNKTTTKAGLNMETPELMKKGGDSGPSIIPGKSAESLIVEASEHEFDLEMPPKNNKSDAVDLTKTELVTLKKWIDQGAKSSVREERKVVWHPLAPGVHPIYSLAMTEDGRFAACGRSNQIFVYDLATREFVTQIVDSAEKTGAHKALVHSLAFSPDGSRLASGGYREVKIWKKETGKAVLRKGDASLAAQISVISRDGSRIVSADKSGALIVLNAADGKLIRKIDTVAPKGAKLLSLSPDATLAAVFEEGWKLSVWDLASGKLRVSQDFPDAASRKEITAAIGVLQSAVKAENASKEAVKKTASDKSLADKSLAEIKAKLAQAANPDMQKQLAEGNQKLVALTQASTKAVAAVKAAQTKKLAAEKVLNAAKAKETQARKVAVRTMVWTADGKAVATAGEDKVIRLWTVPAAGTLRFSVPSELKGSTGTITLLAAGGNQIISAGDDSKVRIWNLADGKVAKEIPRAGIVSMSLSSDGKTLATGGTDSIVRLWDTATAKQTFELRGSVSAKQKVADLNWMIARQVLEQAHQKSVETAVTAKNKGLDDLLKKTNDDKVAMTKKLPAAEKAVQPAKDATAAAQKKVDEAAAVIAKAPDGKADAAMEKALKDAQDKLITAKIAEKSAGAAVAAAKTNITDAETQVKRINGTKQENLKEIAAAKAAGEESKKIQAKATTDLAEANKSLTSAGVRPLSLAFSEDNKEVAAVFTDGSMNIWGTSTGLALGGAQGVVTTGASISGASPNGFAACLSNSTYISPRGASSWKLEKVIGGEKDLTLFADRVNALTFSPDGKTLATGGGDVSRSGDVILFEVASGKVKASWIDRHDDTVVSLDFSPDGKLLASGATDKIARVVDVASGKEVNLFEGHTHHVTGVSFRSDGRVLATAGADGVVNSWDMLIGERKKKIEGWTKEVTSVQFIGATDQMVTSAGDNLIRIVRDSGSQVRSIAKLPDFMQAAASTPDGATIIGGGEDSFLRVWDGASGKELAAFGSN